MKYKLGEKHPTENLYRVVALKTFCNVHEGDMGGWVAGEHNLSHGGDAWVSGNAQVHGDARVYGDAHVFGNTQVYGNAWVYGDAWVHGYAQVYGDAHVFGNTQVYGNAWVYGDAHVFGNAQVHGDARVFAPPKKEWVGLTDEEKNKLVDAFYGTDIQLLEVVEAKLKEKNT